LALPCASPSVPPERPVTITRPAVPCCGRCHVVVMVDLAARLDMDAHPARRSPALVGRVGTSRPSRPGRPMLAMVTLTNRSRCPSIILVSPDPLVTRSAAVPSAAITRSATMPAAITCLQRYQRGEIA